MSNICAYETDAGRWVVSDDGVWLPGIFESEAVALRAATLPDPVLAALGRIYRTDGENRPVTADDLAQLDGKADG